MITETRDRNDIFVRFIVPKGLRPSLKPQGFQHITDPSQQCPSLPNLRSFHLCEISIVDINSRCWDGKTRSMKARPIIRTSQLYISIVQYRFQHFITQSLLQRKLFLAISISYFPYTIECICQKEANLSLYCGVRLLKTIVFPKFIFLRL